MNNQVILALTLFLSLSKPIYSQVFEGEIYYEVEVNYKGNNERHKIYYEQEKFGDTVVVSVNSDGYIRREFVNSSSNYGTEMYVYNPEENKQMASYRFTDTVYWYYADTNYVQNFQILDDCDSESLIYNGTELECIKTTGYDPVLRLKTESVYYYDPDKYEFNFKSWSENMDFLQGEIYALAKSNFLIYHLDYGNYEYKMKAVKIVEKDIDDSVFKFNSKRPFKKH